MDVKTLWDDLLTERDRRVITNAGYGKPRGLGSTPLLMVIDCQYNYIGADRPVDEQQGEWPAGGGEEAWKAVRTAARLLQAARSVGIPVIYTRNVQKRTVRFDSFAGKSTWDKRSTLDESQGSRIVDEIAPGEDDFVLDKSYASAFYGTPLLNYLVGMGIDTIVVAGVSTSGCVRATAVDGVTRGFRVAVVADAVADRIDASHRIALLDLWMKYADVIDADEAVKYFEELVRSEHG
jgi:nicotinamidase-related amidase